MNGRVMHPCRIPRPTSKVLSKIFPVLTQALLVYVNRLENIPDLTYNIELGENLSE